MSISARTILSLKTRALRVLDSSPTRAQVKKMYLKIIFLHGERRFCVALIIIQSVKTTRVTRRQKAPSASEAQDSLLTYTHGITNGLVKQLVGYFSEFLSYLSIL